MLGNRSGFFSSRAKVAFAAGALQRRPDLGQGRFHFPRRRVRVVERLHLRLQRDEIRLLGTNRSSRYRAEVRDERIGQAIAERKEGAGELAKLLGIDPSRSTGFYATRRS